MAAFAGAILMILYYFPIVDFPYAGDHSYLIVEHVVYTAALTYLGIMRAGRVWGFDRIIAKRGY